MNQQNLLEDVLQRREFNIAAAGLDVAHQLQKWPVMLDVPDKVREKNQEGHNSAQPDPFASEDAPLPSQQQPDDDAQAEHGNGILFFHADAGDDTEPEPIAGILALDSKDCEVGASHPQNWFEAVGGQQAAIGKIKRPNGHGNGAEHNSEAASAQLARDHGAHHHQR